MLVNILLCFDLGSQLAAGSPDREYGSWNKMSNREDEDEDKDKTPGGGHAKVKRR